MSFQFAEDPLPTDLRYPLNRGLLTSALGAAGIDNVQRALFTRQKRQERVLQADFWPTGPVTDQGSFFAPGKASISVFAVSETEADAIRKMIVDSALSQLCVWLRKAEAAEPTWRAESHSIAFEYGTEGLSVVEI